jgi:hypothetical protein
MCPGAQARLPAASAARAASKLKNWPLTLALSSWTLRPVRPARPRSRRRSWASRPWIRSSDSALASHGTPRPTARPGDCWLPDLLPGHHDAVRSANRRSMRFSGSRSAARSAMPSAGEWRPEAKVGVAATADAMPKEGLNSLPLATISPLPSRPARPMPLRLIRAVLRFRKLPGRRPLNPLTPAAAAAPHRTTRRLCRDSRRQGAGGSTDSAPSLFVVMGLDGHSHGRTYIR